MGTVKVRYAIGGILVAGLLALPASPAAGQGPKTATLAARQCVQERAAIGRRAFRKKYGAKHAVRTCAKRNRARVSIAVATAAQDCQAELSDLGEAEFVDEYGDDPTDSLDSVMDECVAEDVDEILNPDSGDDTSEDDGE